MEELKDKCEQKLETTFSFRQAFNHDYPNYSPNNFTLYALETNEEKNKEEGKSYQIEILGNLVVENDKVEKDDVIIPCGCDQGTVVECKCCYDNPFKSFDSIEKKVKFLVTYLNIDY